MDFFAGQDAARRKTSLLLLYFGLAVIVIILVIYLSVTFLFVFQGGRTGQFPAAGFWQPDLFGAVVCGTLLVVASGSLYKIASLRAGGARVAEMLGSRLIPASSDHFLEKRLLNVVAEMAIASGVPVPPVYLMEEEKGINAFAAGYTPEDAVIGITRGALDFLDREELQGVIGHEFSHILNGDMRLDLKIVGVLNGILLLAFIGRSILQGSRRSRSSKNGGAAVLFGLFLLILGYIGVLFGKLIKSAVSRQREYLADASAVQFTRNPSGLAGALKKIGGLAAGSLLDNDKAEEISHMFFSNGLKPSWLSAFSTHPPLADRIVRIDPTFDGTYPKVIPRQESRSGAEKIAEPEKSAEGLVPKAIPVIALTILAADPRSVTRDIGAPLREHMELAGRLLDALPQQVRAAANDPFGARAVIYGLLLDKHNKTVRLHQLEHLRSAADPAVFAATEKILPDLLVLAEEVRLPLMDLAMPSLRSMSLDQFRVFAANINSLVRIDKRVSFFEYVLEYVVVRRLEKNYVTAQGFVKVIDSVHEVAEEVSAVLSLLADLGQDDAAEAGQAFADAAAIFKGTGAALRFMPAEEWQAINLDAILNRLAQLSPGVKQRLVTAAFQSLVHDKHITIKEAEFFRLLVYALDIPMPPWIKI
ncbi:MAG: M48 family metallopeptidase [Desulfobulbales bacterium]